MTSSRSRLTGIACILVLGSICVLPQAAADDGEECGLPANGSVDTQEVPQGTDVVECDLVGRPLDLGPTSLEIPPAGESVTMTADGVDDDGVTAVVTTAADGEVSYKVDEIGEEAASTDGQEPDLVWTGAIPSSVYATNGCDDPYTGATRSKYLRSTWNFYIGDGGLPATGSAAQFASAIEAAGKTWSTEITPCSSTDLSRAPDVNYAGTTTTEADIGVSGSTTVCTSRDGTSTIDAGDLSTGVVAANCTWTNDSEDVIESDIRFNIGDYDFTYTPATDCSGHYDVRSVMAHEVGHTYGMKDKEAPSSVYQTMYYASHRCHSWARDLGKSDLSHLRSHYPW